MAPTLKRHRVLILGLLLSANFIAYSCTDLVRSDIKPVQPAKSTIEFHRSIQKVNGRGGFAYHGIREKLQIEDYALAGVEKMPARSAWLDGEKKLYTEHLKMGKYDLLVLPFQTQWDGVDSIGRTLMSYRLASAIERKTDLRVAPLPLVQLALGATARVIDDDQVYALAGQMGCKHVIWGFAGTREDSLGHVMSLDLTIAIQAADDYGTTNGIRRKNWTNLDIRSNQLPSILFEQLLGEVLGFLGFSETAKKSTVIGSSVVSQNIPHTPAMFFHEDARDAIRQSYLFQFMGTLIPPLAEFQKNYMFIRSLAALDEANPNHPDYAILKARAYYHLHRRPAALEVLGDHQNAEARFLVQLLNGNLPQLKQTLERIDAPLQKFFAAVEYMYLKMGYTAVLDKDLVKNIVAQYPEWEYFFDLILNDPDGWDLRPNLPLKQCLDAHFPVQGFSLKELASRLSPQAAQEEMAVIFDQSFQEHIHKRIAAEPLINLLSTNPHGPCAVDYLLMLEGIGQSNLVKQVRFYKDIQCSLDSALQSCNQFLKSYGGHPYFVLLHAAILCEQAYPLQGEQKTQLLKTALNEALQGLWWYGRQGWAYFKAKSVLLSTDRLRLVENQRIKPFKTLLYGIASDYPPIPDCARSGNMRLREDLIDWSTSGIHDLKAMVSIYSMDDKQKARNLIQTKLRGRFKGHPHRHIIELVEQSMTQSVEDPKIPYIRMIGQGTRNWKIYKSLGELHVNEGEYAKARDIFLDYPGFAKGAPENRVGLSYKAYIAGSYLFWQGASTEARPLYEFSAALDTGSHASLTSSARLALLDRDFPTAARYMLRCAQRYDSSYRYRDYMTFAHLMGESSTAWQMFPTLLGRFPEPHIWTSAFVGHRLQHTEKHVLIHWISDMAGQNQTSRQRSFPARFGLLCLIDRPPDFKFADFIESVDDLSKYQFRKKVVMGPDRKMLGPEHFGSLAYADFDSSKDFYEAMKRYYTDEMPDEPFSFYGSFSKAYEHLKKREYAESYRILKERSRLYSYQDIYLGVAFKPYLVWTGLKSGHQKEIDHFLYTILVKTGLKQPHTGKKNFPELPPEIFGSTKQFGFDSELSLAVYLCWTGDHESAVDRLHKAFHVIPYTDKRPLFPWYQMIEVCEWLYQHSEDKRYLDLALKWVKDYQVIQPMFGWAFAFEAKYTAVPQDRIRALGYALYLDPQSWRIADFTEQEKQAAHDWFQEQNPYLARPKK